jgi:arylsulfatase A-like enzyme
LEQRVSSRITRRSFIKKAAVAGGGVVASQAITPFAAAARSQRRPNILVIVVDQMRLPRWFPAQDALDTLLPNLARIRGRATQFENHYTAANMCVAARGTMLTGLYGHQTGCMLTKAVADSSTLSDKFPTWGTMLRQHGYKTAWWGKWHLGPVPDKTEGGLEAYGFDGGTYPSPNGNPEQGKEKDPSIADQFTGWIDGVSGRQPWCTTVSLVNPHDINWWPRFTSADEVTAASDYRFTRSPPNVETAAQLQANKPRLQTALEQTIAVASGPVPNEGGPLEEAGWAENRTMYLIYQQEVDKQIGRVLDALHARPELEDNTIVIFTADHGEYAGSHGLRAKGGGAYEEAINVPLYIYDPRGKLSNGATARTQLTSTVDIAPLLLTIATGSSSWRSTSQYSHLASRGDIAAIAADPSAAGRPWIAHITDETTVEELSYTYSFANEAPHHVAAVRTANAKYAVYSPWKPGTIEVDTSDQDFELYDYTSSDELLEVNNVAGKGSALERELSALLQSEVIPKEIRAPLPRHLRAAQKEGMEDFYARTAELTP